MGSEMCIRDSSDEHQHALKEVDAAALAVTKNVDEIVNILQYSVEGSLEF